MRRSFSRWWLGLSCLALLASGCGKDPFVPDRRSKPGPTVGEADRSKPVYLVYVLPGGPTTDQLVWGARAQQVANERRAIFRVMGPGPEDGPAKQAEIVRMAVADGASALIIYPGDSPELPKALAEAEAKGVPVVLISKTIAAPEGSKPFAVVGPAPFEPSAKQIVAATIEDSKKAKQPADGTALVTVDKLTDDSSGRRVAALKAAAEAAKFRQVVMVPFDSATEDSAKRAVLEAVKANPDVSVVLADDAEGMFGAALARVESKAKPIFFVGGYSDVRSSAALQKPPRESCHVEGRFSEYGDAAILIALARLRGESGDEMLLVKPRYTKTEGVVWTEGETIVPVLQKASEEKAPEPKEGRSKDLKPPSGGEKPQ